MTETLDIDERGLSVPPELREFDRQIVFRSPRATIQHYGSDPLDEQYGKIDATHFGDTDGMRDPKNPELAPDRVRIKPEGEDAREFTVDLSGKEVGEA